MDSNILAYSLALLANIIFAFSIQIFAHYSRTVSAIWMNFIKALIALFFFSIAILLMNWDFSFSSKVILLLFCSGLLGLGIGDLALLTALRDLGPGRAMLLVAFHPIITGILSYFFFDQHLSMNKMIAILFMILCILVYSIESVKREGNWGSKGIALVMTAICLDSLGVMMVKEAELLSNINTFEANFFRCLGAVSFFLIWTCFKPFGIWKGLKAQSFKSINIIIIGSFLGTFLALALIFKAYTSADNLAVISSINISGSIFAALFECIHKKKAPGRYLLISFLFMIAGVSTFIFVD
ncbi:MAG: DMT family transporter [Lentisphaeraceae bacterium]|nr:DMT family transporter [Lentisphaeraceae bacterium]